VDVGGVALGTLLSYGGEEVVVSGGHTSGTVVSAGGYEYISSGGLALQTVVSIGGSEMVSALGVVSGLFLLSAGGLVDDGAVRVAAARTFRGAVSGSGALAVLGNGDLVLSDAGSALAGSAIINGGTIELAASGAIGTGSVVFGGGTASHTLQIDAADAPAAGGTFANVISNFSGSHDFIDLRGLAYVAGASATVSGGVLTLSDGGETYKFDLAGSIGSAGTLYPVTSDGHGGTLIDPTSTITVSSGVTSSGLRITDGEELIVDSGGHIQSCTVVNHGSAVISSGGYASATVVSSGGVMSDYGIASGTEVRHGGILYVVGGGRASGAVVGSGGIEYVSGGGVASATVVGLDGSEIVSSGGVASGTVVTVGSEIVDSGGVTSGTVLSSRDSDHGLEIVYSGGHVSGTVVSSGSYENVFSGGLASGTLVNSSGYEYVLGGGLALQTLVSSGGSAVVSAGGVVSGLFLSSGGALVDDGAVRIAAARTFRGAVSGSGALAVIGSGDLILSGDGSAFAGSAVINGGTIELAASGAIGTGSVVFGGGTASHTLQIDAADAPAAGGTFANVISNFSGSHDYIDLRGLAFVSGASATVSGGVLTLSDGGHTYKFDLAGSIGSAGTLYPVTSDGHGGTLIDPQVAGFVQTMAGFAPAAAASPTLVSSGGTSAHAALFTATASGAGAMR
jgi:autotransporter passenger strand-loop-strand repeat protein